jgi:hypothetical protein
MLPFLIVIAAVIFRFLPHEFNFAPLGAALLFFGAKMPRNQAWMALGLVAVSDVILTKFVYAYPFTADHLVVFAWYIAIVMFGSLLRDNETPLKLAGASLFCSTSFFVASNFAVWAFSDMYAKTLEGLGTAFVMAIPFFRNTFMGDMLFTAVFFGTPVLITGVQRALAANRTAAAA